MKGIMLKQPPEWQTSQPLVSPEKQSLERIWKEIGEYGGEEYLTLPRASSLWDLIDRDEVERWMYVILLIAGIIEVHVLHTYATLIGWSVLSISNRSR